MRYILPVLILSTALLAACSSDDDDGAPPDDAAAADTDTADDAGMVGAGGDSDDPDANDDDAGSTTDGAAEPPAVLVGSATRVGVVNVTQSGDLSSADITANFLRIDNALPLVEISTQLLGRRDSCEVTRSEFDIGPPTDIDFDFDLDVPFDSISAGEVIPIMNAAGSVVDLLRRSQAGFTFYVPADGALPATLPSGLFGSIPGDEYPAVDRFDIPDNSPLLNVSPASTEAVTADTSFSWEAGDGDSLVSISASSFSLGDTITTVVVSCTAADDGRFSFPGGIRSELGSDFEAFGYSISRTAISSVRINDNTALFVLSDAPG